MTGLPGGAVPEDFPPETMREEPAPLDVPEDFPEEASAEDVQEQHEAVVDEPAPDEDERPDEASEADVSEQRQEVALDEEDAPIG